MKKKFGILLALLLTVSVALAGCSKPSPEEQFKAGMEQISSAKTIDGWLETDVTVETMGMSVTMELSMDTKLDRSSKWPKVDLKGNLSLMGQSDEFEIYMDDTMVYSSFEGETNSQEITEEQKEQLAQALSSGMMQEDITPTKVTRTYEGKNQVLTADYDAAALSRELNQAFQNIPELQELDMEQMPEISIQKLQYVLVLDENDVPKELRGQIQMNMTVEEESMDITLDYAFFINSLGEPVKITPPSTTDTTKRKIIEETEKEKTETTDTTQTKPSIFGW